MLAVVAANDNCQHQQDPGIDRVNERDSGTLRRLPSHVRQGRLKGHAEPGSKGPGDAVWVTVPLWVEYT